jgi:hypothetical protein
MIGIELGTRNWKLLSEIDPFFGMAARIPAWIVAKVRKQRVNTGSILGGQGKEFRLAVLHRDCVVAMDCDLAVGLAVSPNAVAQH